VLNILMREAGLRLDDDPRSAEMAADGDDPELWRANAFVTNVVKYRPPGNRTPGFREIQRGKKTVRREWLALGGPRAIVCVGGVAHSALSPNGIVSISTVAGRGWYPMSDDKTICFSQFHPAFGLRRGEHTQKIMTEHWQVMGEMLREALIL
jgi:DNA polymerase